MSDSDISDANLNAPPVSGGELRNEKKYSNGGKHARYSIADMKSRLARI